MDEAHVEYLASKMNHCARKMWIISKLRTLDPITEGLETMNIALSVMERREATGIRSSGITDEWIVRNMANGMSRLRKVARLRTRYGDLDKAFDYYSALFSVCVETIMRGLPLASLLTTTGE